MTVRPLPWRPPMTRSRWARLAAVLAATGMSLPVAAAGPAAAADTCQALVVDHEHVLDTGAVARAARLVQDQAADIRVRVYGPVPNGDLDAAVRAEEHRCAGWLDQDGTEKNNLIILALSLDADHQHGHTGLYYGAVWDDELRQTWTAIQAKEMNPRFKAGDFTGGMVGGLTAVAHTIDAAYSGPGQDATSDPGPANNPAPYAAGDQQGAGSTAAFGWVLATLAGLALLVGGAFGAVTVRRRRNDRAAARAAAAAAGEKIGTEFVDLDASSKLVGERVARLPQVDDPVVTGARDQYSAADAATKAATDRYLALAERYPVDAIARMNTAAARVAATELGEASEAMTAATAALAAVDASIDHLERLRTELPAQVQRIRDAAAQVAQLLPERERAGFHVTGFADQMPGLDAGCGDVTTLLAESRYGAAGEKADALLQQAQTLLATVTDLPKTQQQLRAGLDQLRTEHTRLLGEATDADHVLSDLDTAYAASCSADVHARMRAAHDALDTVPALLAALDEASSMATQRFDDARSVASRARSLLADAAAACGTPAARRDELETLSRLLPGDVEAVHGAVRQVEATMLEHPAAVGFLTDAPDVPGLRGRADDLTAALAQSRPALLEIRDNLAELRAHVEQAQAAVDAVVREFASLQSLLRQVRTDVENAHAAADRMHAGTTAKSLADDASRLLASAEAAADLGEASRLANAALDRAHDADEEARRAINHYNASNSSSNFGTGFATGAAFGSSMSDSGFGGGGFDGGGSSSFGGGADGGGSSSW